MERTSEENREVLRRNNLPELPDGDVTEIRFRVYHEDWYAKVDEKWYWLDARSGIALKWMPTYYGPGSVREQ